MKSKKIQILLAAVGILLIILMIIYRVFFYEDKRVKNPVTIGYVSKGIALMLHSQEECEGFSNRFKSDENNWYEKYMNALYEDGFLTEKEFTPNERTAISELTYGRLEAILKRMKLDKNLIEDIIGKNKKNKLVAQDKWIKIYSRLLEEYNVVNIENKTITVVGTISNTPKLNTWEMVTDKGHYLYEGLNMDQYLDTTIEMWVRDDQVIAVRGIVSEIITYKNAWVINSTKDLLKVFIYGIERDIIIDGSGDEFINSVADIFIEKHKVTNVYVKKDSITGKVLSSDYNYIEIEGYGKVPLEEDYRVYKVYGALEEKGVRDILIGYDSQIFIVAEGRICAAVIDRDINAKNIRVLISNESYDSIFHEGVILSSNGGMTITYGDKKIIADPKEKVYIEKNSGLLEEGRVCFVSNDIKGTIKIESIDRKYGTPRYRGSIEVALYDDGLTVVNELPLEEYLYSVVPSEMPAYYPIEALKTQAVCARTYAYKHLLSNSYNKYGAHVDDSTSFQVYNNVEEQEITNAAVNDTYGQIITYEDKPITAYFYSTSCGSTADSSIWGMDLPYIKHVLLHKDGKDLKLSDEEVFKNFIKADYNSYESDISWFRWNVEFDIEQLGKLVNSNIASIYKKNNNHVLTLENGKYIKKSIESIGDLKSISVGERENSGLLASVIFEGTEATVKVFYQTNLRKIFSTKGLQLYKHDGTVSLKVSSLPSGFFCFEEILENGAITGYKVYGGGYGHGAGMSQNGAKGMAEENYTYEEIIKTFYNEIDFKQIYK